MPSKAKSKRSWARFPEVWHVTVRLPPGGKDRVEEALADEGLAGGAYLRRLVVADLNRRDATVAKPRASSGRG